MESWGIEVIRVYTAPAVGGRRVLVDRLWPRGVSKERAAIDDWAKDLAPSPELRSWYDHEVERFDEFSRRYRLELEQESAQIKLAELAKLVKTTKLYLVTATTDVQHSSAAILRQVLVSRGDRP